MARFFTPAEQILEGTAYILGEDAFHISRVLRKGSGDIITLCDGAGKDYSCRITAGFPERIDFEIISSFDSESEAALKLRLFVALSKGDKLEYVIQKCVELGVFEIIPFVSSRCVVKLSGKDSSRKVERWQRIAYEASKQSGRGIIPRVHDVLSFNEMIKSAVSSENALFLFEGERESSLKNALDSCVGESLSIVIGPEGGFSLDEVERAVDNGLVSVSLGKRILRCETAPVCAVSAIMFHTDNL